MRIATWLGVVGNRERGSHEPGDQSWDPILVVQEGDQAATQVGAREEAVRWFGILRDDATQLAQNVHLPLAATDDVGLLGSAVSSKTRDDGYLCADDGCTRSSGEPLTSTRRCQL